MRRLARAALVVALVAALGGCSLFARLDFGDVTLALHRAGHAVMGAGSHVAIRIR